MLCIRWAKSSSLTHNHPPTPSPPKKKTSKGGQDRLPRRHVAQPPPGGRLLRRLRLRRPPLPPLPHVPLAAVRNTPLFRLVWLVIHPCWWWCGCASVEREGWKQTHTTPKF